MSLGELEGSAALECDQENVLLHPIAQMRRIGSGFVRPLRISAAHEQQRPTVRDEGNVGNLHTVVRAVARERPRVQP